MVLSAPLCVCANTLLISPAPKAELTLSTAEEFIAFAESCRLDSYSAGLTVRLTADIDLSGEEFSGVPIFGGSFYGDGHTVTVDITCDGSHVGLFRTLTASALVTDLTVTGTITPQGSRNFVGGIAGENAGTVTGCSFNGTLSGSDRVGGIVGENTGTVTRCTASGQIHGIHFIGGIAGRNSGAVTDCENRAEVNTTPQQNTVKLEDITIDSITGAESAATVTDIGGIVGSSSGTVALCTNYAAVGYRLMGYNIGGIAGSQSGWLNGCWNFGTISGRKEVGGIAGQLEPVTLIDYSVDTLQILQKQIEVLGTLVDQMSENAKSNTAYITRLIGSLQSDVLSIRAAADSLSDMVASGNLDLAALSSVLDTISSKLSNAASTLEKLLSAVQNTTSDLTRDLEAIALQMDVIEQTLSTGGENLGGSLTDASDADTLADRTAKISMCWNYGSITADLNAGGIVGAMSPENDLDPEEDIAVYGDRSMNIQGSLRAVVDGCENRGSVSVRKQNGGGIAGFMGLGLVKSSLNAASVSGGDYVGGIAGMSYGYLRLCSAKCDLTGDSQVGGIAGLATTVSDCRAMVQLSAREYLGAIAGQDSGWGEIMANYYLCPDADPGAIDGVSYAGRGQSLPAEAFLQLPDLAKLFRTVTASFVYEDGTVVPVSVTPGQDLLPEQIPAVPEKSGYTGYWEGLTSLALPFDVTYRAAYTPLTTVLAAGDSLLVEGTFSPTAAIRIDSVSQLPALADNQRLLVQSNIHVTGAEKNLTLRIRLPQDCNADRLSLLVRSGNDWQEADFTADGSWLVFSAHGPDVAYLLAETESIPLAMLILPAAAAAVVIAAAVAVIRKKRKTKAKAAEETETTA